MQVYLRTNGWYLLIPENDISCSEITGEMKLVIEEKCLFIINVDLVYALVGRNIISNPERRIASVIKGMHGDSLTLGVLMAG